MAEHKFKIGQMVYFHPRSRGIDAPANRPSRSHNGCPRQAANINKNQKPIRGAQRAVSENELRAAQQS